MNERERPIYIDICIGYRIFTLLLSTVAYDVVMSKHGRTMEYWVIVLGMIISCLLSSCLYKKIGQREPYLRLMFAIEVFFYGIFMFLSGGFSSPYLWHQVGCISLMIVLERHRLVATCASIWCFLCAVAGKNEHGGLSYQDLNVCMGMIMVIGGFYMLRFYIQYIDRQNGLLAGLSLKWKEEKERSEYAVIQLTNLYETFNLFAMTNPEKIISQLLLLLKRSIAVSGCILLKFDGGGDLERKGIYEIQEDAAQKLIEEVIERNRENRDYYEKKVLLLEAEEGQYQAEYIGEDTCFRGVLIRKSIDVGKANEEFYLKLIEIVFSNLDIYNQMERFITTEEQNRIANEIHDTVIQKMFGMVCSLKVLEGKLRDMKEEEVVEYIRNLKRSIELTMTELRESIYGRKFQQAVDTFTGAMKLYMEEAQRLSGTQIVMEIDKESDYMTSAQKIAVYRIACEAVNNAVRHGKASQIDIKVLLDSEFIKMCIEDNGSGFEQHKQNAFEGNGLKNMRNITSLLKGTLILGSEKGKGVNIRLSLPR